MNEEPINPGYSNQIFEFSEKKPNVNRTQFVFADISDAEMTFEYELQFMKEYIKLSVDAICHVKSKNGGTSIEPIKNKYSYKIITAHEILPEELLIILQNCTERLSLALEQEIPPLQTLPKGLPNPLWADNAESLTLLSQKINAH